MKQVQRLQEDMATLQAGLAQKTVSAEVGGGMVKVLVNGKLEVLSLTIEKEVINPDDPEMLRDLVIAAVNEGIRRAQALAMDEAKRLTGGIPGLSDLLAGVR
jgi:DNA-binding YbaB/EbfC family protein